MEINSDDGYTGTVILEDGTVISINGGFVSFIEKDGSIMIESVMAFNDNYHKNGITQKVVMDSTVKFNIVNGTIMGVEVAE